MMPILQILRALPPASLRALDKFMASPYFVTHTGTMRLYEYVRAHLQGVPDAPFDKAAAARHLGETPQRLYHLTNYLLEAVERFLALEAWQVRPAEAHLLTVEALRRLQLGDLSASMLRYARRRLYADPHRGTSHHRTAHALHLEAYQLSQQQGRTKAFNLQELSDAQDVALLTEKLRTGCMLLSHEAVAKKTYDKGLLEPVLQFLDGHRFLEIPAVAAYYHGYFAQADGPDSGAHLRQLKILLDLHADQLAMNEVHDLYLMAINFCIRRINRSESAYVRDVFDLYQSGLRHGALLEGRALSRWTYTNIALTALKLHEYDWTYRFLHDYAPLLAAEHRTGTFHFNLARYYYDTGDRAAAMQHLLRMEYDDVLQNLMAKTLLCKIYYETDAHDALDNQLDSIEIYLRRKKVLGYHKDNYTAIVRLMRRLLALNLADKKAVQALREQVEAAPALTERAWFLAQLERLYRRTPFGAR